MERVRALAVPAAALTGLLLAADAVLGVLADTDDHTRGAGLVSELLFAAALLLVAAVVAGIHVTQVHRSSGTWRVVGTVGCWLSVVALATAAAVAVSVPIRGEEPPDAVSTPVVLAALLGLVAFGVAVAVVGVVRRWVGVFLAVFFLVVFLGGAAGALVAAAAWLLVAWTLRGASARPSPRADSGARADLTRSARRR